MNAKSFWEEKRKCQAEMQKELLRVQCEAADKGYEYAGNLDFGYSKFWFELETLNSDLCRISRHFFACKNVEDLKKAIGWILNDTKFYEVTAFVEGCAYVTFWSQKDIDMCFDTYYGVRA